MRPPRLFVVLRLAAAIAAVDSISEAVIRVRMPHTVRANPFHHCPIASPVRRECPHRMVAGIVDHAELGGTRRVNPGQNLTSTSGVLVAFRVELSVRPDVHDGFTATASPA